MDENSTFIDYSRIEVDRERGGRNTKEILNSLLKKMLDHKLNKLEKKHIEESNSLKIMSKISQNIIITLEHYSHKVRKEIYKIRHKNDETHTKKRESIKKNYDMNKSMWKEDKNNISNGDNNIESLISKDSKESKFTYDPSNPNNKKRPSKSIDPRKDKSFLSEISINTKEKKSKKEKMDVFARLASKSIGNFKKLKLDINGPSNTHLQSSKSKGKKFTGSTKSLHNIISNKKNEGEKEKEKNNEHSPEGSNYGEKNTKKFISTPKLKQKQLKKIVQINIESQGNKNLGNDSSKNLFNTARLKKTNSKGKLTHRLSKTLAGLKKEEKIENNKMFEKKEKKNDIAPEINNEKNDNKISELKKSNSKTNLNNNDVKNGLNSNNEEKHQNNEKLLMDEEIIKNVNKDELLISQIKEEKIEEITLDDIDLKNSINLNLDSNLIKKSNLEANNNISNHNNNTTLNNIKIISPNNQSNSNTSNSNINQNNVSSHNNTSKGNNINNIIITNPKNNPVNFLADDNEINFTLVEDSPLEENDNDFNKTIDLNISGLSDQLSLEEKFETHLDEISRYLDMKDLCNIMLVNKECFTSIMNVLISKTEITIDILEEELSKLKETNKDIDFSKVRIGQFKFSSNSARAVSLLNNSSGCNLIKFKKEQSSMNKEIFIIFGIFFIAAGKKKEYLNLNSDEEKINYITNFFKNDIEKMSLGSLIEKEINGKIFDNNIISSLYKYSYKYIHIISPNRFQKTNKDIAIFVFVVKNILEHIGALDQQNIKPDKEYILYNARLQNNKSILEHLNSFFEKIN